MTWWVIKNTKTNTYSDGCYGWTTKEEEAQRYWSKEVPSSHDHIMFVRYNNQQENEVVNIDDAIAAYIKLRDKKGAIKAEAEQKAGELTAKMDKLEAWIKEQADNQGVTSFKTKHGTAFLTTVDFANVADWDAILKFVRENDAYDMFEKRISKSAVRGYIDQTKAVPPGVNYGTRIEVNVRKPTNKED